MPIEIFYSTFDQAKWFSWINFIGYLTHWNFRPIISYCKITLQHSRKTLHYDDQYVSFTFTYVTITITHNWEKNVTGLRDTNKSTLLGECWSGAGQWIGQFWAWNMWHICIGFKLYYFSFFISAISTGSLGGLHNRLSQDSACKQYNMKAIVRVCCSESKYPYIKASSELILEKGKIKYCKVSFLDTAALPNSHGYLASLGPGELMAE